MYQNEWLDIILIAGFAQGLFLCFVLWKKERANRQALQYLVTALGLLSLLMVGRATFQPSFVQRFAMVIMLPDVILFLGGPLVYFFILSLLRRELPAKPGIYLHYLPALFHVAVVNTTVGLNLNGTWSFMTMKQIIFMMIIIEVAAIISFLVYFLLSHRAYRRYREAYYQKYAAPFLGRFLRPFFILAFSMIGIWVIGFTYNYSMERPDYMAYVIVWFLLAALIYFLAYQVYSHPELLELPELREEDAGPAVEVSPQWIEKLARFMDGEKPYLDPEIKIGVLAEALDIPKHELSKVINHGFGKNFFDFINGYRIREFIALSRDERNERLNILELAYQSGFNSKSAFNRAFRKEAGQSPSAYLKSLDSVSP
ncbi:MAG: helix-turn-helix transcriptional regulator [Lewinellaceae bacterium]|nr:helix-turn-helix transcriptional regulator [Phaeodactylibacter sp.]MCB9039492.1 helix-turn-helix transcriptional regulator [Lewinellaceae bacterium]